MNSALPAGQEKSCSVFMVWVSFVAMWIGQAHLAVISRPSHKPTTCTSRMHQATANLKKYSVEEQKLAAQKPHFGKLLIIFVQKYIYEAGVAVIFSAIYK